MREQSPNFLLWFLRPPVLHRSMTLSFPELPQILLSSLQVPADCTELLWDSPAKRSTSTAWRVEVMPDVELLEEGSLKKNGNSKENSCPQFCFMSRIFSGIWEPSMAWAPIRIKWFSSRPSLIFFIRAYVLLSVFYSLPLISSTFCWAIKCNQGNLFNHLSRRHLYVYFINSINLLILCGTFISISKIEASATRFLILFWAMVYELCIELT